MLPVGAQDLQGPVGLADQQGTARPGQHGRLRRDLRPVQGRGDDGVHRCQQGSACLLGQVGQLARRAYREHFREVLRAPRDALDRRIGQLRACLPGQVSPRPVTHIRVRVGFMNAAEQLVPGGREKLGFQVTSRYDRGHHQDLAVMPAGQILDHGDGQAQIQKLRVIHGHQHRGRHRHGRHRSRRPGHRALLPGRAGIPGVPRRRHRERGEQQRHRGRQPGGEQAADPQPELNLTGRRVKAEQPGGT